MCLFNASSGQICKFSLSQAMQEDEDDNTYLTPTTDNPDEHYLRTDGENATADTPDEHQPRTLPANELRNQVCAVSLSVKESMPAIQHGESMNYCMLG